MDDSDETRQALRELLEELGITIVGEAAEGAEAIGLARKLTPDVVLMDLKMPGWVGSRPRRSSPAAFPIRASSCSPRSMMSR